MFRSNRLIQALVATTLLMSMLMMPVKVSAQDKQKDFAPINTAVPSLSIAPDARGGAMGDNGASTLPDENSQFWNPAKFAFMTSKAGVALSYTPWLRKLVKDVALANLSGYFKIGDSDMQAIGASLRYFTLGEITNSSESTPQAPGYTVSPYEMAFDISYSRKLSDYYSMAVALRYIRSDMGNMESEEQEAGNAYAADVAGYMEKYVMLGNAESLWSFGFNISNIGTKISYDGGTTNQFIPTTLRIGTGLLYPMDEFNRIGFYLDLSKYLVPTLPKNQGTLPEEIDHYNKLKEDYNSMSGISGMIRSFSDAPGGFSEELQEINISFGAEYSYNEQFFLRGGYYYENPNKGNRQYFSVGAGFRMNIFQLDAAYLISTVQSNPLDQTLRFSLSFDMDGLKDLIR